MKPQGQHQYAMVKAVEDAFDTLVDRTHDACNVYRQEAGDAWALHHPRPDADWLENALLDFWYENGQDGRATRPYVGLIAATPRLMAAIDAVNEAKLSFQERLREIKELDDKIYAPMKGALLHRHPHVKRNIEGAGLARLNLKQAWRHIPTVNQPVSRVHFSWYQGGRSIKRMTVADAEKQLIALGSEKPHIKIQLQLLAGLPSSEPLAQIQPQAPLVRANVFFDNDAAQERAAMNVALPLFVLSDDGVLPFHNEPAPFPPTERTRSPRRDRKIEDAPFLRSIRVHRYRVVSEKEMTA